MNLSQKFILSIIIIIIIIILIVIVTTINRERLIFFEQMKRKGFLLTEVLAMSSVNAFLNYDYSTLHRYISRIKEDSDIIYVMILDKDFIIKMHNNIDLLGEIIDDDLNKKTLQYEKSNFQINKINNNEEIYEVATPIITQDQLLGIVRIAFSNKSVFINIKKSRDNLLIIGVIAIIIGIIGAVFMANKISKPIKKLAVAAKTISKGNLDWNIDIKSNDEIGILASTFSYMTLSLKQYIKSLIKTEKLAILGELASVIAHEVRNPMEPIKGSTVIIQKKYKYDKVIQKYTKIIKEEIAGLCDFLDSFLEFAKPQEPSFNSVNLNLIVDELLYFSKHYIVEHKMRIEKYFTNNLPNISADSRQLKQVFMNLIFNSIQAKKDKNDEGLIKISTSFNKKTNHVLVEFIDFGEGIKNENIEKIFDPFFTTKKSGSGLGLSICQTIIERHHGKIEIKSKVGKYTIIKISFPIQIKELQ